MKIGGSVFAQSEKGGRCPREGGLHSLEDCSRGDEVSSSPWTRGKRSMRSSGGKGIRVEKGGESPTPKFRKKKKGSCLRIASGGEGVRVHP